VPAEIHVPAVKVELHIDNSDELPAEFESTDLSARSGTGPRSDGVHRPAGCRSLPFLQPTFHQEAEVGSGRRRSTK